MNILINVHVNIVVIVHVKIPLLGERFLYLDLKPKTFAVGFLTLNVDVGLPWPVP